MRFRNIAASLLFMLGMSIACGSCGIAGCARILMNAEGDGMVPRTTLTSITLGYSRFDSCELIGDWHCFGPHVLYRGPWGSDTLLARKVATKVWWPMEWVSSLVLMIAAIKLSADPKRT